MSQEQTKDMSQYFYRASAEDFMKIPGQAIAYWSSSSVILAFKQNQPLSTNIETREGLTTGSNDLFLRLWHEISIHEIGFGISSSIHAISSKKRYFPYVKGGDFRRWSGNFDYVVNWHNDGEELKCFKDPTTGRVRSHNYNGDYGFKPGFTWSGISSGTFAVRNVPCGFMFDAKGPMGFSKDERKQGLHEAFLNCSVTNHLLKMLAPTLDFKLGHILNLPSIEGLAKEATQNRDCCLNISLKDWNTYETSWDFTHHSLTNTEQHHPVLNVTYQKIRTHWHEMTLEMQRLEERNNRIFINAYGLQDELTPEVPLNEITLTCNPHYRYGGDKSEAELESLLQSDTICELLSYSIGCMMGRYSLDREGLVYAHAGNEGFDELVAEEAYKTFPADDNGIIPISDQEWFRDDATIRLRDFIRTVWGEEHLKENLDFLAESLCLNAIKPKKGESSLDTIRRYFTTQFFKDHLKTYKKRPIYWLFSSGKHKAFECLVYLHRYNASTLAKIRTEYVIPLTAKLSTYVHQLEQDKEASTSAAETKRIEKEIEKLHKQQVELSTFEEKLRHYADQRIELDLDDGVKVNYGKFGDLLAEVKAVTGESPS